MSKKRAATEDVALLKYQLVLTLMDGEAGSFGVVAHMAANPPSATVDVIDGSRAPDAVAWLANAEHVVALRSALKKEALQTTGSARIASIYATTVMIAMVRTLSLYFDASDTEQEYLLNLERWFLDG